METRTDEIQADWDDKMDVLARTAEQEIPLRVLPGDSVKETITAGLSCSSTGTSILVDGIDVSEGSFEDNGLKSGARITVVPWSAVTREIILWMMHPDSDWADSWHVEELPGDESTSRWWPVGEEAFGAEGCAVGTEVVEESYPTAEPRHGGRVIGNGYDGKERTGHSLATVGRRVFVVGGSQRSWVYVSWAEPEIGTVLVTGDVVSFDIVNGKWSQHPPMSTPRMHHGCVAIGQSLYVLGGCLDVYEDSAGRLDLDYQDYDAAVGLTEVLDTATGEWGVMSPMPTPRMQASCVVYGATIYVIGGAMKCPRFSSRSRNAEMVVGTVEALDTTTGQWRTLPPMPTARKGHTAICMEERGLICITGGFSYEQNGRYEADVDCVEVFDIQTETWSSGTRATVPLSCVMKTFSSKVCACGTELYRQGDRVFRCNAAKLRCEYVMPPGAESEGEWESVESGAVTKGQSGPMQGLVQGNRQVNASLQADTRMPSTITEYSICVRIEGIIKELDNICVASTDDVHEMVHHIMDEQEGAHYDHRCTKICIGGLGVPLGKTFSEAEIEEGAMISVSTEKIPLATTISPAEFYEATIFAHGCLEVTEIASGKLIGWWDLLLPEVWAPLDKEEDAASCWWEHDSEHLRPYRGLRHEEMAMAYGAVSKAISITFACGTSACIHIQADGVYSYPQYIQDMCGDFPIPHIVFDVERGHADLLWLAYEDLEADLTYLIQDTNDTTYDDPCWLQTRLIDDPTRGITEVPSHSRVVCHHESSGAVVLTPHFFPWKRGIMPEGASCRVLEAAARPITSEHFTRTS